ncbi:hypothetical protein HK104_007141 [Borealophlyctis nickersoniae]|nr:hypothetical protein HK104_007141 [Borealophlyctis nickersoniae]
MPTHLLPRSLPLRLPLLCPVRRITTTPPTLSAIKEGQSLHPRGGAGQASREEARDAEATSGDRYRRVPPGFEARKDEGVEGRFRFYQLDADEKARRQDAPGWEGWTVDPKTLKIDIKQQSKGKEGGDGKR